MAKKPPADPLDQLAEGPLERVVMLMLWVARRRQPDMFVQINPKDIQGFEESMKYQKMKPALLVHRPPGLPAQAAIPAAGRNRAVPAREAIPSKPYVIVTVVEEGTKNVIRSIENNQEDYDEAQAAAAVRKARDQAGMLAESLLRQARTGEYSLSEMQDAATCLVTLAQAQQL